ncbi:MAG: phosphate/phosphite/phosphonate ABC transporter substrate-binding protein [Geminicoccales bacterium]
MATAGRERKICPGGSSMIAEALTDRPKGSPAGRGRDRWSLWTGLVLAFVLATGSPARALEDQPQTRSAYQFGVFPYLPTLTIDRIFGPMAGHFAIELGRPVHLRTKPTFEQFAQELERQTYEIVFVHPFFYVEAADRYDYLPVARLNEPMTAVIMVDARRPWRGLPDLAGKILALPPALAAVSELTRAALIEVGLQPGFDLVLRHHRTKMSCLQAVAIGSADACAVPTFVLSQIDPIAKLKLRPLAETRSVRHFVLAAHARVPKAERVKLQRSVLSWPSTAQGRQVLAAGAWSGFVAADDREYDEVRALARLAQGMSSRCP